MTDYSDFENNRLLIEQKDVCQKEGEPFRKIYFSRLSDFTFWYKDETCLDFMGVQISLPDSHVITALKNKPVSYTTSADSNEKFYRASILKSDGFADHDLLDHYLAHMLIQLPEKEMKYAQKVLEEIKNGNYVRYPVTI